MAENGDQAFAVLAEQLQQLMARLTTASPAPPAPAPAAAAPSFIDGPEPHVGTPECDDGDPESCNAFIMNCCFHCSTFASVAAKVAFAITYLTGKAREWPNGSSMSPECTSFSAFVGELQKVFGHCGV